MRTSSTGQDSAFMLMISGASSLLTYLAGLVIVHQFAPSEFSAYSSTTSLLLIVGIVTTSMQQWPIATLLTKGYSIGARRLARYGAFAVGPTLALVVGLVVTSYADLSVSWAAAAASFAVTIGATAAGYLQATCSNRTMGVLRLVEAVVRTGVMLLGALAVTTWLAVGSIVAGTGGFAVLAAILSARQLRKNNSGEFTRNAFTPAPVVKTALAGLALQGLATLLTSVAVLSVVTGAEGASSQLGGYQALTVLTRVPVLIAGALALVMFVPLTKGKFHTAWDSLSFYLRTATVVALIVVTLPPSIYQLLLGERAAGWSIELVFALAASGWFGGLVLLLTAVAQARGVIRAPVATLILLVFIDYQLASFFWKTGGPLAMAITDALVMAVAATAFALGLRRHAPRMLTAFTSLTWVLVGIPLWLLSMASGVSQFALVVYVLLAGVLGLASLVQRHYPNGDTKHLRILHLAYEDPNQPGAGGGSVHSQQVNERLTQAGHTVVAIHRRYANAKTRVENGVTWRPLGIPKVADSSIKASTVLYFLTLPFALPFLIAKYNPDVIVDDFGAPISSLPLRWITTHPLVGMAQWADAQGKSKQYRMPFAFIERLGFASHRDIIAVSEDLARSLRARAKHATVHVIPNGVPNEVKQPRQAVKLDGWVSNRDVVYLGRLESPQKGINTLIECWPQVLASKPELKLWLVGDGPDRPELEALAAELKIQDSVIFTGRINGAARLDILADAALVAMPSHYETFGMVAAEALAVGTPVVVTDIDSLRDFVTPETGLAVLGHEPSDWSAAVLAGLQPELREIAKTAGPKFVAKYDWDIIAKQIESILVTSRRFTRIKSHPSDQPLERAFPANQRTLLFGNYGNGNTGDEAILARMLEVAPDKSVITVASRNPQAIIERHSVSSVRLLSLQGAIAWMRSERLVVGGGGMFGPGQPLLISILPAVLIISRMLGKSVAFAGVGVYQGMPRFSKYLLGIATRVATPCLVRDDASTRTLDLRFGPRVVELIPDAGFGLTMNEPEAREILNAADLEPHRPLLLISPKAGLDTTMNERSIRVLAQAAKSWYQRGGEVGMLLLSHGSEFGLGRAWSDQILALKIAATAEVPVAMFGPNLAPQTAKALVSFADAVIGMRFHALVFAASTNTPMASLTFEEKSRSLIAQHGGFNVLPDQWQEGAFDPWIEAEISRRVGTGHDSITQPIFRECLPQTDVLPQAAIEAGVKITVNRVRCQEPQLSIVMPSYNTDLEELRSTVRRALKVVGEHGEVIIVDDGSTNDSPQQLDDIEGPLMVVRQPNGGKGAALRTGMLLAKGNWVGLIDADGDYAPEEIPSLIEIARSRGDLVAVGHRDLGSSGYETFRLLASWVFRFWTKIWINPQVGDTEAGIKVISGRLIPTLLPQLHENSFAIDVDMFSALKRLGMTSAEGPVSFVHDDHTTVTLRKGALAFVGVVRVALRNSRANEE